MGFLCGIGMMTAHATVDQQRTMTQKQAEISALTDREVAAYGQMNLNANGPADRRLQLEYLRASEKTLEAYLHLYHMQRDCSLPVGCAFKRDARWKVNKTWKELVELRKGIKKFDGGKPFNKLGLVDAAELIEK